MFAHLFLYPSSWFGLLLYTALLLCSLLLLVPAAVLFVECVAALLPVRRNRQAARPSLAVLMPAHNEALGIEPVIKGILAQLYPTDRLVVIADNCTDDTAACATAAGATVIERQDKERRGKGYALDRGLQFLTAAPPEVVICMDADCLPQEGTLELIAATANAAGRPVQAVYLMETPARPRPKDAVSALAFLVKNWVRPLGLHRMGYPATLTGTGMAFPWEVIRSVSLASGNIVEDMQLSMDLAVSGFPTLLCPAALVVGQLPEQAAAAKTQRTRWEHGHLRTMRTQVPRLVGQALAQKRLSLLVIALDLLVPPLSLLVMLLFALTGVAGVFGLVTYAWLPAVICVTAALMVTSATLLAWLRFGRKQLPAKTLFAVPFYVLWKIPLYLSYMIRPQTKWVRTERDPASKP